MVVRWLSEIDDAFRRSPPRIAPAANDFAKWDFEEGDRLPVRWMRDGYGDQSLFGDANRATYRALWLGNGLWRMRWYHETGFGAGAVSAATRLLAGAGQEFGVR